MGKEGGEDGKELSPGEDLKKLWEANDSTGDGGRVQGRNGNNRGGGKEKKLTRGGTGREVRGCEITERSRKKGEISTTKAVERPTGGGNAKCQKSQHIVNKEKPVLNLGKGKDCAARKDTPYL